MLPLNYSMYKKFCLCLSNNLILSYFMTHTVIFILSSGGDVREFMLHAYHHNMLGGDYAFITIELFRSEAWGDFSWKRGGLYFDTKKKLCSHGILVHVVNRVNLGLGIVLSKHGLELF